MDIRVLVFNSGTFNRAELSKMSEQELWQLWEKDDDQAQVQMYYLDEFSCAFNDEEVSDQDWLYFVDYDNIKQSDENPAKDTTAKRKVWLRMGITLCGDEQDIEQVVSGKDGSEDTLMRLMKESSFVIDGDTYIPEPCIEQYNKDYGTTHEVGDVGFNLYDATEYHIAPAE